MFFFGSFTGMLMLMLTGAFMQPDRVRTCRPALVRQIARCSCGHRTRPVVMEEGRLPSMLPCSQSCEAAARRVQLNSAFGVNPQTYVSWVDRAR